MTEIDLNSLNVVNNTTRNRFEVLIGEHTAVLDYRLDGDTLRLLHAGTPKPLRGHGIAGVVTKAALEYAREHGYKVDPVCSYVVAFIRRYPEYKDLVEA